MCKAERLPAVYRGIHRAHHAIQIGFLNGFGDDKAAVALEIGRELGVVAVRQQKETRDTRLQPFGQFDPVQTWRMHRAARDVEAHALRQLEPGIGIVDGYDTETARMKIGRASCRERVCLGV